MSSRRAERILLDAGETMEAEGSTMPPLPEPVLLEPTDVALALRLSVSSVRRLADEGELVPCARTRRGVRLFTEAEVSKVRSKRAKRGTGE
jgi:hypothetical protein